MIKNYFPKPEKKNDLSMQTKWAYYIKAKLRTMITCQEKKLYYKGKEKKSYQTPEKEKNKNKR